MDCICCSDLCCAVKRADEIIFNSQSGDASRVKKSDDTAAGAAGLETEHAGINDGSDAKKRESEVEDVDETEASDSVKTETGDNQHGKQLHTDVIWL